MSPLPDERLSVYFIEAIGVALNPDKRLTELQTGSPVPLRLMARIRGGRQTEDLLHTQFAHLRTHGEWFKAEPDIVQFVDEYLLSAGPILALLQGEQA